MLGKSDAMALSISIEQRRLPEHPKDQSPAKVPSRDHVSYLLVIIELDYMQTPDAHYSVVWTIPSTRSDDGGDFILASDCRDLTEISVT